MKVLNKDNSRSKKECLNCWLFEGKKNSKSQFNHSTEGALQKGELDFQLFNFIFKCFICFKYLLNIMNVVRLHSKCKVFDLLSRCFITPSLFSFTVILYIVVNELPGKEGGSTIPYIDRYVRLPSEPGTPLQAAAQAGFSLPQQPVPTSEMLDDEITF